MTDNFLTAEENIAINLKRLYKSYGYRAYGLASFEEYSLYTENIDFLTSGSVATFNSNGKLLALRPDVTLSIAKNIKLKKGETAKIFYDEKVYRTSNSAKEFKEVSQIGVEIMGEVDEVSQAELITLALKTLNQVDTHFILDVAHMGITAALLSELNLSTEDETKVLSFLKSKNLNGFESFIKDKNCTNASVNAFKTLIRCDGEPFYVLGKIKENNLNEAAIRAVEELETVLNTVGETKNINIDFSIVNSSAYYNGIIFKGYLSCVPYSVLSGGRYDNLSKSFNKNLCAIGFALYLGELSAYLSDNKSDAEIAVLYNGKNAKLAFATAEKLRKKNKSVLLCKNVPCDYKGKIVYPKEELI
ncbi:MAG: ATP phosphoribosyltransferase regulatory subunit [Clostridia bacterium]|nr:ATP phosphoribosyltransferase regulatory subunit [Clostridia bacterium]